jgi:DNA polymerase I-like protein with 3'-5' exonuclease and polymerase domains
MANFRSKIVNSVHDSIVIDIHPDEESTVIGVIELVNNDLKQIIDKKFNIDFNVPLALEAKLGLNWLDQKEV